MDDGMVICKLEELLKDTRDKLEKHVIEWLLEGVNENVSNGCDAEYVFTDFFKCGCEGGYVNHLINYVDCWSFFQAYYSEIESVRMSWKDDVGDDVVIPGEDDLATHLSRFAFTYYVNEIYSKMED